MTLVDYVLRFISLGAIGWAGVNLGLWRRDVVARRRAQQQPPVNPDDLDQVTRNNQERPT